MKVKRFIYIAFSAVLCTGALTTVSACDDSSIEDTSISEDSNYIAESNLENVTEKGYYFDDTYHWTLGKDGDIKNKEEHNFSEKSDICSKCGVSNGQNYFQYKFISNGSICVTNYYGSAKSLVLSSIFVNGFEYEITQIDEYAFQYNPVLENVYLSSNISYIHEGAFSNCPNLKTINFYSSVTEIEFGIVSNCDNIVSVNLVNGELEDWLNINFDDSLVDANYWNPSYNASNEYFNLYFNSVLVDNLVLPNTDRIAAFAFAGCLSLESVSVPKTIKYFESYCFSCCPNLCEVYYDGELLDWCRINFGDEYSYDAECSNPLVNGANLYIKGELFTEMSWDSTFSNTSAGAFAGCLSLSTLYVYPTSAFNNYHLFFECNILSLYFKGTISQWCKLDLSNDPFEQASIHNFYVDDSLVSYLVIPNDITKIGLFQFYGLNSIKTVFIPNTITDFDSFAFAYCSGIQSVVFEKKCQVSDFFYDFIECEKLESIVIPKSVSYIYMSFTGCSKLSTIFYEGDENSWGKIDIPRIDDANILSAATIYYYSENEPISIGNYWHYDADGKVPSIW